MSEIFLLKLLLSFFVGGAAVSLSIMLSERFGPKIGGIILGLPIMSAVSLFFIGFTQSAEAAATAAAIIPATLAAGLIFLLVFVSVFRKLGMWGSLAVALSVFFVFSSAFPIFNLGNTYVNIIVFIVIVPIVMRLVMGFPSKRISYKPRKREMVFRALLGGCVVVSAVMAAKLIGPLWGGMFSAIPAAYISMLFIVTRLHGLEFTKAIIRSVPVGTTGTLVYAIAIQSAYPAVGIYLGTLAGYICAIAWVIFLHLPVFRKFKSAAPSNQVI